MGFSISYHRSWHIEDCYKSTMDTISIRATDTVAKWLVKECQDVLIIPITKLVNTS